MQREILRAGELVIRTKKARRRRYRFVGLLRGARPNEHVQRGLLHEEPGHVRAIKGASRHRATREAAHLVTLDIARPQRVTRRAIVRLDFDWDARLQLPVEGRRGVVEHVRPGAVRDRDRDFTDLVDAVISEAPVNVNSRSGRLDVRGKVVFVRPVAVEVSEHRPRNHMALARWLVTAVART